MDKHDVTMADLAAELGELAVSVSVSVDAPPDPDDTEFPTAADLELVDMSWRRFSGKQGGLTVDERQWRADFRRLQKTTGLALLKLDKERQELHDALAALDQSQAELRAAKEEIANLRGQLDIAGYNVDQLTADRQALRDEDRALKQNIKMLRQTLVRTLEVLAQFTGQNISASIEDDPGHPQHYIVRYTLNGVAVRYSTQTGEIRLNAGLGNSLTVTVGNGGIPSPLRAAVSAFWAEIHKPKPTPASVDNSKRLPGTELLNKYIETDNEDDRIFLAALARIAAETMEGAIITRPSDYIWHNISGRPRR